jgi:hypothetical protein
MNHYATVVIAFLLSSVTASAPAAPAVVPLAPRQSISATLMVQRERRRMLALALAYYMLQQNVSAAAMLPLLHILACRARILRVTSFGPSCIRKAHGCPGSGTTVSVPVVVAVLAGRASSSVYSVAKYPFGSVAWPSGPTGPASSIWKGFDSELGLEVLREHVKTLNE